MADPFIAVKRIREEGPDVITLYVEMSRIDGVVFLQEMLSQRPIPVVACSSLTEKGSGKVVKSLKMERWESSRSREWEPRVLICAAVRAASQARERDVGEIILEMAPKLTHGLGQ